MPRATWKDFAQGLVTLGDGEVAVEEPRRAPPNALVRADNVFVQPDGTLRGRRGTAKINATPLQTSPATGNVMALHSHNPRGFTRMYGPKIATDLDQVDAGFPGTNHDWDAIVSTTFPDPGERKRTAIPTTGEYSYHLKVHTFQLVIDPGESIAGVEIEFYARTVSLSTTVSETLGPGNFEATAFLQKPGPTDSDTKELRSGFNNTEWHRFILGGPGDLWGLSLLDTDVEDDDFTFVMYVRRLSGDGAMYCEVRDMRVIVHTTGGATLSPTLIAAHTDSAAAAFTHYTTFNDGTGEFDALDSLAGTSVARPSIFTWPEKGSTYIFNGVHAPQRYNGVGLADIVANDDYLAVPKGPYAVLHRNRIYATRPDELEYSVYSCEPLDETTWRADTQLTVNDGQGGRITGLASHQEGLFIFKDTSLFIFSGDPLYGGSMRMLSRDGCIAPGTVASTPFGVLYLGERGLLMSNGVSAVPLEVSAAVRGLFRGRLSDTAKTTAVGAWIPDLQIYLLRNAVADGAVYAVSIGQGSEDGLSVKWTRLPGFPMTCLATTERSSLPRRVYLGGDDGFVREFDIGTDDDGEDIAIDIITAPAEVLPTYPGGVATMVTADTRRARQVSLGVQHDREDMDAVEVEATAAAIVPVPSPTFQVERLFRNDRSKTGRLLALRIKNSGDGPEFELHRATIEYDPLTQEFF